ncbi:PUB1 [Candida jiufengensis]|uniref:PUB1 n=1 Tax=Candida jiufengensis TaxID=497108 RepID=UPI0022252AA0|nr:PUB1 [Candida jiufengensis]KAI5952679.1 PUB1 [Candida jiufengensis]
MSETNSNTTNKLEDQPTQSTNHITEQSTTTTESQPSQEQSQEEAQQQTPQQQPEIVASAVDGGREMSNKILYVGNLPKSASEDQISELFSVAKPIKSIKLLNDKNNLGFNYAFIEFDENQDADMALSTLNGKLINNSEIKVNWAYQSATITNNNSLEDPLYNIFVGDLSSEVNDESLKKAFEKFGSLKQAHVMWDMQTSRSRGYGFVSFNKKEDAELALQTMNGEWLGGRAIRCNWASHKQQNNNNNNFSNGGGYSQNNYNNGYRSHNNMNNNRHQFRNNNINNNKYQNQYTQNGQSPQNSGLNGLMLHDLGSNGTLSQQSSHQQLNGNGIGSNQQQQQQQNNSNNNNNNNNNNITVMSPQSYDIVLRQTPSWQTTVYLGNIAHFTQQQELIPLLQNFGYIVDFKFHPERGYAFVKYDSHERAALAIIQLAGFNLNGRPIKCGWGK